MKFFILFSILNLFANKNMIRKSDLIFLKTEETKNQHDEKKIDKNIEYQPVEIVQSVSPASKKYFDILKSGDPAYVDLLLKGYESPNFQGETLPYTLTPVSISANLNKEAISFMPNPNEKFSNVEFIHQNRNVVDSTTFATPVQYSIQNVVGHLPTE